MVQLIRIIACFVLLASLASAHPGRYRYNYYRYGDHLNCGWDATRLYQRDFENGTVIITEPGEYCLGEDVKFFPNSEETLLYYGKEASWRQVGRVLPEQMSPQPTYGNVWYDPSNYGVGFFAAISIASDDVTLDLNGYSLGMSPEFALLQRFYADIEIGDQPFISG
jgi:hypothetical protein